MEDIEEIAFYKDAIRRASAIQEISAIEKALKTASVSIANATYSCNVANKIRLRCAVVAFLGPGRCEGYQ
jgi:hypothetical protein